MRSRVLIALLPTYVTMEAEMRVVVSTFAGLVACLALSAQAPPLGPPQPSAAELGAAAPIELVRDGCGYGYYRTRWQDGWGYWHWGRCVPKGWGRGAFQQQREWW
jgi:hypothetical protein